jgi:hypothetical protein
MYASSILAGAVALIVTIPSLVSAAEVTPPRPAGRVLGTVGWIGFAVSPNRRVFKSEPQQGEIGARSIAKNECETATLRTCSVIAVPESTDVSAVGCTYGGRSESFVGGSVVNRQNRVALDKARNEGFPETTCVEFYTY